MSAPLPPELAALERALEATRAPLPAGLRARVLAASAAVPLRPRARSTAWFAAAAAIAAAALLNLSNSLALPSSEAGEAGGAPRAGCARALLWMGAPAACLDPPVANPGDDRWNSR